MVILLAHAHIRNMYETINCTLIRLDDDRSHSRIYYGMYYIYFDHLQARFLQGKKEFCCHKNVSASTFDIKILLLLDINYLII